jgi:integrase
MGSRRRCTALRPTRSSVCDLRWDQIDFNGAVMHVRRVKNGTPSTHPIQGDEMRGEVLPPGGEQHNLGEAVGGSVHTPQGAAGRVVLP